MAKHIRFTPEMIAKYQEEFYEHLRSAKLQDGKFEFKKTLDAPKEKATLHFTINAYLKMTRLVQAFTTEVAWHGVAYRDGDKNYCIRDIIVYPQSVTGTTVNTDQEKYEEWMMGLDDETFNNLRMQGHSHVNMATSPSGVDLDHQRRILDMLEGDMFYIFLIWNKKDERTVKIYDLKDNLLYENADINVLIDGLEDYSLFEAAARKMVTYKTYYPTYNQGTSTPTTPATTPTQTSYGSNKPQPTTLPTKEKKKEPFNGGKKCNTEDDNDPYGPFGYSDNYPNSTYDYWD